MDLSKVLSSIDAEISRLQQARDVLSSEGVGTRGGKSAVRPSVNGKGRHKRAMSAEARERIAEAQRKRWAAQKKAAN